MTGEAASAQTLTRLGTYELVRPLAQGGMADIYLARDGHADRHVAVKVLNTSRAVDAEACSMFLDEARVVALLHHHNIASVLDVNVADGHHYLAMEYVHGADLRELLSAAAHLDQTIPYEVAISILMGAAAGLEYAHRTCGPDGMPLELVHRDVSLSNIMVAHDGAVKVVDFGIASTTIATVHTCPGVVRGKASYMSPEQCLGDPVDQRTDVFALGIVLYELTTGARCFAGKSDFDRMLAVVRGDYILPRDILPDFPPELEQVIRCALSIDATQRFPSAAALIEALERVVQGRAWAVGPNRIARLMRELFGEVPEPWAMVAAEPVVTERSHVIVPQIVPQISQAPTVRSSPRLARGTESDIGEEPRFARGSEPDLLRACGWRPEPEEDEVTRGRRPLKRSAPAIVRSA